MSASVSTGPPPPPPPPPASCTTSAFLSGHHQLAMPSMPKSKSDENIERSKLLLDIERGVQLKRCRPDVSFLSNNENYSIKKNLNLSPPYASLHWNFLWCDVLRHISHSNLDFYFVDFMQSLIFFI